MIVFKLIPQFVRIISISSVLFVGLLQSRSVAQQSENLRIGFYNVENYFDPFVDSTRQYNEFTADGAQRWSYRRYLTKRNHTFKTITAMGEGNPIALLGMCEVENEFVLKDLLYNTPLKKFPFQFINYPSPDRRGIDAALIYRKDVLRLISSKPIPLRDSLDPEFKSRDILLASFSVSDTDTLFVLINHWPSRYGGEVETIERRMLAALTLKKQVDSIVALQPNAKLVIMGDFNDSPNDPSILNGLKAVAETEINDSSLLINLFTDASKLGFDGTLKHQYDWQIFDQIMVSKSLYDANNRLVLEPHSARIFHPDFLFEADDRYMGRKLFRTYVGPRYIGGFSDHLPVFIDLKLINHASQSDLKN